MDEDSTSQHKLEKKAVVKEKENITAIAARDNWKDWSILSKHYLKGFGPTRIDLFVCPVFGQCSFQQGIHCRNKWKWCSNPPPSLW